MGHSDVNLTVKRYGRFAAEAKEQFAWINALAQPVEALAWISTERDSTKKVPHQQPLVDLALVQGKAEARAFAHSG